MKISLAMATHNGQTYLEEQFESIFSQTRLPDEIIVYDDASSDGTPAKLKEIQARAPVKMKIISGTFNLHVNGSFSAALNECVGDIVFFSDQDDIWEPDKISRFMEVFERRRDIGVVFSNASQIDERGQALKGSLWQTVGFTTRRKACFKQNSVGEMLKGGNFIYGMASAFRTECIRPVCPVLADPRGMTHDTWFALHTLATGWKAELLDDQLVRYRRHRNQATRTAGMGQTVKAGNLFEIRRRQMAALIDSLFLVRSGVERALAVRSEDTRSHAIRQLDDKVSFLVMRQKLRAERTPHLAAQALLSRGYWKYSKGFVSVLRDLSGL